MFSSTLAGNRRGWKPQQEQCIKSSIDMLGNNGHSSAVVGPKWDQLSDISRQGLNSVIIVYLARLNTTKHVDTLFRLPT